MKKFIISIDAGTTSNRTILFDLNGKTALITWSSQGIGYALAKGLADAGSDIILNGRNLETLINVWISHMKIVLFLRQEKLKTLILLKILNVNN